MTLWDGNNNISNQSGEKRRICVVNQIKWLNMENRDTSKQWLKRFFSAAFDCRGFLQLYTTFFRLSFHWEAALFVCMVKIIFNLWVVGLTRLQRTILKLTILSIHFVLNFFQVSVTNMIWNYCLVMPLIFDSDSLRHSLFLLFALYLLSRTN